MAFIKDPKAPYPEGFEPRWREVLERKVAIYRRLPEGLTAELEALIPWFLDKVEWSAYGGIRLHDEMKICVAAEACLLILRRSKDEYKYHQEVVITPKNLDILGVEDAVGAANRDRVRLGWYWTQHGMEDGEDNYNVTLHEYAHVLDFAHDGRANADIKVGDFNTSKEWLKFAKKAHQRLCKLWDRKTSFTQPVIKKYGTTELCEFFACATETFFEISQQLKLAEPDIYKWIKIIYGLDPAEWPERVDFHDLEGLRSKYASDERRRKRRETEQRRELQEAIRRYEKAKIAHEEEKRKNEKEKQRIEEEKAELDENGLKQALEEINLAHKKKLEEINRRYKGKEIQLERRIREAESRFERDKKETEKKLDRTLARLKWELEKTLTKLKELAGQKPVKPELGKIEEGKLEKPELEEIEEPEFEITQRGPKRRTVSHFHPSGLPYLKFTVVGTLKDGLFLRWDEAGDLREEMHYYLGQKNGLCTYYYPSGSKELEGTFVDDQRAGTWTGWYRNGNVKHKSKYLTGELVEWIKYMPNGSVEKFKKPSKLDKAFSKH